MADPDPEEIRDQIVDAFDGVEYPVANAMEFLPALPDGPATTFESGSFSMSVMELQEATADGAVRFPYHGPEAVADDFVDGLREAGELPG